MIEIWAKRLLTAIVVGCAISCTTCCRTNYVYRPVDEQVFFIPEESAITAPARSVITTDGVEGKVELRELSVPYDGILLSDGYFLKLYRAAQKGNRVE